jgi:transcriptional regulator with XRE-family HTH domain
MGSMDDVVRTSGRLRLAGELRRLRDLSGVSGRELARRIAISQSKVSRIESGMVMPSLPEVTAWGTALGASQATLDHLAFLTNQAFTEVQPWREALRDKGHLQDEIQEQEALARHIRTFQSYIVPGLLQTAEYTRRVFSIRQPPYAEEDLSAAVAARLNRQQVMFGQGRQFDFLIAEAALYWRPGPARMLLGQFDRIASIMTLENVSIGLIRYDQEAVTWIAHGFVIYDGLEDDQHGFVSVEMLQGETTFHDPLDVEIYRDQWLSLREMAIFDNEARDYLTALADGIRSASSDRNARAPRPNAAPPRG